MSGFIALLQESLADRQTEQDAEYISLVQHAISRMGQLIDDLLRFSRVGRSEINRSVGPSPQTSSQSRFGGRLRTKSSKTADSFLPRW